MLAIGGLTGQALALDPTQAVGSYLHTHFSKEDGLPSSIVNVILQTRNGFLWVGTAEGLARFDGRHFTTIEFSRTRLQEPAIPAAEGQAGGGDQRRVSCGAAGGEGGMNDGRAVRFSRRAL
jgi:ligand-binding sensor domain-containing protein